MKPDDSAVTMVVQQLGAVPYDCVVIGGGLRVPASSLLMFEKLVNAVHRAAPHAAIAFDTAPSDTAEAAARWVDRKGA